VKPTVENPSHPESLGICPIHYLEMRRTKTGWECPIDGTTWLSPPSPRFPFLGEISRRSKIGFQVFQPIFVPFKLAIGAILLMTGLLTVSLNLVTGFNLGVSIAGADPISAGFLFSGTILLLDGLVRLLFSDN
jgi:hypothetical protein